MRIAITLQSLRHLGGIGIYTRRIVYTKKRPWNFPWAMYLRPFARPSLFDHGFCIQALGMNELAVRLILSSWQSRIQVFWNLVNLEIWGRLFFLGESLEQVNELVFRMERDPIC